MMDKDISIYDYLNYRKFLSDLFELRKEREGFTLRQFAHKAGFSSHAYLSQVIQGQRDVSEKSARKIAKGFELSEEEGEYFENLVRFSHADDLSEKNEFYKKIIRYRSKHKPAAMDKEHYFLISNWYILAVRELVTLPDFREDPQWIAQNLNPRISRSQAEEALKVLEKLKYLVRDENGRLKQNEPDISTGSEVKSLHAANYHNSIFVLANDAIRRTPARNRDISALILPVDKEEFRYIKSRVQEFRLELIQYLRDRRGEDEETADKNSGLKSKDAGESVQGFESVESADRVLYNLSMQFFNLSPLKWD